MTKVFATQVLMCATAPLLAATTLLDPGDIGGWDIVITDTATEAERYAAKEFQSLFQRVSGLELPLSNKLSDKPGHVLIGPDLVESGPSNLHEESLYIRIATDRVEITGGRPRGTLYGVYEFFEKYLGVRFLTYDHTHVPPLTPVVRIPVGTYTYRPPLAFRDSYYRENRVHPEFAAQRRVNTVPTAAHFGGLSSQQLISHTFHYQIPTSKYGKEHPEYFALRNGKRLSQVANDGWESEPCLTNPDVLDIVTQHVLEEIAKQPHRKNFSVSQNDNPFGCQCEHCSAIDEREGTPMGSLLTFVNAVAERVEKRHPEVMIGTLAYWHTRKPPKSIRPRKNVQVQLCSIECCTLHPIDDPKCEKNVTFARELENWRKLTDQIWIWNYNVNFSHFDLPFPNLRSIGPNVRFFAQNGARGIFMQCDSHSIAAEMSDLRNYIISGMLWDPSRSGQVLQDEFIRLHYRSAAPAIRAYVELIHDNAEAKSLHPACFASARQVGLDPLIAAQAMDLFQHALALAAADVVRARVEKASIAAYSAMLEAGATLHVENGLLKPAYPKRFGDVTSQYIELTKRCGLTRLDEFGQIEDYYRVIRKSDAGQSFIRLENGVWRITLLPETSGKVIELFHKPSRQHLVEGILASRCPSGLGQSIEERAMVGYKHDDPSEFESIRDGNTVRLIKPLANNSTLERMIALLPDEPEKIYFKSVFTHNGEPSYTYQFYVRCDFLEPIDPYGAGRIDGYGRSDRWQRVSGDWLERETDAAAVLYKADVNGIALFNPDARSGLALRFDAVKTLRPQLALKSISHRGDLEILTQRFELDPGETVEYEYTMEFIDDVPTD